MANVYLISVVNPSNSVTSYFTSSNGVLSSIGTTEDFAKGFNDTELALLNNDDYAGLIKQFMINNDPSTVVSNLLIQSSTTPTVTVTPIDYGIVETTDSTSVNLQGYSGINGINITATGGKYAISFDDRVTWKAAYTAYTANSTDLFPGMTAATTNGYTIATTVTPSSGSIQNLMDNDNATSVAWGAVATEIDLTLPSAVPVGGFSVTPVLAANMPSAFTLEYNDGTNWNVLKSYTGLTWTDNTKANFLFDSAITTATKYRMVTSAAVNGSTITIGEIELLSCDSAIAWQTVTEDNISIKGMSLAFINSLGYTNYADVFTRTQLDLMGYLSSSETITNFVVSLPPNAGPVIKNVVFSTGNTMHKGSVVMTCNIVDLEGDAMTYKVLFNDVTFLDTTTTDGNVSVTFPETEFTIGTNKITIVATDARSAATTGIYYVTRTDAAPTIVGSLSGNYYQASIGDPEGDKVSYQITLNGEVVKAYTDLAASPVSMSYVMDKSKINYGVTNTLRIDVKDDMGVTNYVEETFVGDYYALLFCDTDGSFYSTDLGAVLKKIDFGTIIASQTSEVKEVKLLNNYGFTIDNVALSVPNTLFIAVTPELSSSNNPFTATSSVNIGSITSHEKKSFFFRISTTKESSGGGDFLVSVKGDPSVV